MIDYSAVSTKCLQEGLTSKKKFFEELNDDNFNNEVPKNDEVVNKREKRNQRIKSIAGKSQGIEALIKRHKEPFRD